MSDPHAASRIVVVSGLPRSGTSMLMRMLAAGGVPLLADARRGADDDNPLGYFEDERVKELGRHASWLVEARGKAVKVVSALLEHLPAGEHYDVLFVRRDLGEVLASQRAMLERRGKHTDAATDDRLRAAFAKHLDAVAASLAQRPDVRVLDLEHASIVADAPAAAAAINRFLGGRLDARAMAAAVEPRLHRQRRG